MSGFLLWGAGSGVLNGSFFARWQPAAESLTRSVPVPPGKRSCRFQSSQVAAENVTNASGPRIKRKPPNPVSSLPGFKLAAVMLLLRDIPPVLSFKPVIHTLPHS